MWTKNLENTHCESDAVNYDIKDHKHSPLSSLLLQIILIEAQPKKDGCAEVMRREEPMCEHK